jgi:hypothetical protein
MVSEDLNSMACILLSLCSFYTKPVDESDDGRIYPTEPPLRPDSGFVSLGECRLPDVLQTLPVARGHVPLGQKFCEYRRHKTDLRHWKGREKRWGFFFCLLCVARLSRVSAGRVLFCVYSVALWIYTKKTRSQGLKWPSGSSSRTRFWFF